MRKFSSYGPITASLHYYVPRTELIEFATQQLLGENFNDGGHYITVWAPRQRGKMTADITLPCGRRANGVKHGQCKTSYGD